MYLILGILIPFIGTTLGASTIYLMKNKVNVWVEKLLLGFASGVMIAASVWSLLVPSIEMADKQNIISWLPASVGFILGIFFLIVIDKITPHIYKGNNLSKNSMMIFAVTLHNIPEGMAVGVAFAGVLLNNSVISLTGATALSLGIAIQNFPEGAIISLPLKSEGMSKHKAFIYGMLSGIVEPIAAVMTLLLTNIITILLPYLLAFAAGAMIYVVVEELIPEFQSNNKSKMGIIGLMIGFIIMMILDVALG